MEQGVRRHLIKPKSRRSREDCGSHFRYPADLFKVQRDLLTRFHVDDPGDFYSQKTSGRSRTTRRRTTERQDQPPYYLLTQRPAETSAVPADQRAQPVRPARTCRRSCRRPATPDDYGDIQVLRLPGNTPFQGPRQVQQSFNTNDDIARDLNLFRGSDSQPVFGNLLSLPFGGTACSTSNRCTWRARARLVPAAAQGAGQLRRPGRLRRHPRARRWTRSSAPAPADAAGDGSGSTADAAHHDAQRSPPSPASPTASPSAPSGNGGQTRDEAVAALDDALAELQDAQQSGDFAAQGQALEDLQTAVEAYRQAAGRRRPPAGEPMRQGAADPAPCSPAPG